jgi:hypothetical protein
MSHNDLMLGLLLAFIAPISYADIQITVSPQGADQSQVDVNGQTVSPPLTPEQQRTADLQAIIDKSAQSQAALQQGSSQRYTNQSVEQAQQDADAAAVAQYQLDQQKAADAAAAAQEAGYNDVQRARVEQDAAFQQQNADRQAQEQLNMQQYTDPAAYAAAMKQKAATQQSDQGQ